MVMARQGWDRVGIMRNDGHWYREVNAAFKPFTRYRGQSVKLDFVVPVATFAGGPSIPTLAKSATRMTQTLELAGC
jgi:hypothetical protein